VYLVDTNVISVAARAEVHRGLAAWMNKHSDTLYLSAITVAEIEDGIAKLRREGSGKRAKALTDWLETLLHLYADRILPFDIPVARIAGVFSDDARGRGRPVGFPDLAIAATAKVHELTLLTRNLKDFDFFDIRVHDPFASLPK
jgi:predicted nucleic acid-binding protein